LRKRKEELENLIDDTRKELTRTIDSLATDLNIRITDLENTLNDKTEELNHKKVDRNLLGHFTCFVRRKNNERLILFMTESEEKLQLLKELLLNEDRVLAQRI
jgi:hypothetical protein